MSDFARREGCTVMTVSCVRWRSLVSTLRNWAVICVHWGERTKPWILGSSCLQNLLSSVDRKSSLSWGSWIQSSPWNYISLQSKLMVELPFPSSPRLRSFTVSYFFEVKSCLLVYMYCMCYICCMCYMCYMPVCAVCAICVICAICLCVLYVLYLLYVLYVLYACVCCMCYMCYMCYMSICAICPSPNSY
jgi:hypothetical protein